MMPSHDVHTLLSEARIRKILQGFKPTLLGASHLRQAAVLLPLFVEGDDLGLVLTVRTHRVEHHKGEISFPGGGRDPEDATLLETALREAHEELGIRPEDVSALGQIDDIQTMSGFQVRPYVGLVPRAYPFRANPREVAEVLPIPVSHLLDVSHRTFDWRLNGDRREHTPRYHYGTHAVWGATARIVHQLLWLIDPRAG